MVIRDVDCVPLAKTLKSPERSSEGIGLVRSAIVRPRSLTSTLGVALSFWLFELFSLLWREEYSRFGITDGVNERTTGA